MSAKWALVPTCFLLLSTSACTSTTTRLAEITEFRWKSATKQVLLVEPDVQLGEITAGGMFDPRADWTHMARQLINSETKRSLEEKGIKLVTVERLTHPRDIQLAKLHSVVGQAILHHLPETARALPNKGDALDWTLGPGSNEMRARYGADYALFLYVRDSYTSAGRAVMIVGAAVLFGAALPGGQQLALASLVDLNTGNIVWFNVLNSGSGDLRTAGPAGKVVDNLLEEFPL